MTYHLNLNLADRSERNLSCPIVARLILYPNELYRLPEQSQGVRVLSGIAWVSLAGQDSFLAQGEKMTFNPDKDFALVSALGQTPLVVEVLGDRCRHPLPILFSEECDSS